MYNELMTNVNKYILKINKHNNKNNKNIITIKKKNNPKFITFCCNRASMSVSMLYSISFQMI